MSEIQQQLPVPAPMDSNPVHPNAKTTTHVNNGTTTTKTNITSPVCRNCKTQTTPLWRRDETGQVLCNACGLFLKLHGRPRPISLKTDTIKSRNRIKQANPSKTSGPNTPELKSKDSRGASMGSGKKSPKLKKKSINEEAKTESGSTTPVLPPTSSNMRLQHSSLIIPPPINSMHHLPSHLASQTQPLHYPSSTPTHFAPGLQRITSPLLLSTTSSLSNARSSSNSSSNLNTITPSNRESNNVNLVAQAAGALENMSNELGPSATFKYSSSNKTQGTSLINKDANSSPEAIKKEPINFSTPSSALNVNGHALPPKLPALGSTTNVNTSKAVSSPSFGPQFHLQQLQSQAQSQAQSQSQSPSQSRASQQPTPSSSTSQQQSPVISATSLPSIQQLSSHINKGSLPNFQNNFNGYNNQQNNSEQNQNYQPPSGNNNNNSNNNNNGNNNNNNNNNGGNDGSGKPSGNSSNDVTLLKTRISELELVNDLYRTRIMELEAMEQAARLREVSMRKRLDDYYNLQDYSIPPFKRENEEENSVSHKKAKVDN